MKVHGNKKWRVQFEHAIKIADQEPVQFYY
jgi:hypothetical protein